MRSRAPSRNAPHLREKALYRVFLHLKGHRASSVFCEALSRPSEAAGRGGIESLPCFMREDLDEDEVNMVMTTAKAQGESTQQLMKYTRVR